MKKYNLKPGKHQFAPGSTAVHVNDNLTDEEAKWYLKQYPHIVSLFVISTEGGKSESQGDIKSSRPKVKRKRISKPTANSLNQ
ncbi:hypothetical protein [Mucilaginibacter glaciei]|uniref:Uncharacterized protein n=1 Tax=Mucilaginibacter glaciei TaxID=2772109 RepID=A0A926NU23_9SPHI|nr:hypothetical protein [Mucilaginibacter glaciei]MBD1394612.1 hypothetical protein [Mucilaginibacter glaciei]